MSLKPILSVLRGQVPERTPIWLMRQAGRYLQEYRDLRSKSENFLNMCLTPDIATEITLQPIRRFNFDAAIVFADILLVPLALGVSLSFPEKGGPVLKKIETREDIDSLFYNQDKISAVFQTIKKTTQNLPPHITMIGFCGAPWTVACYMIDGSSQNKFCFAKEWAAERQDILENLIERLIDASEAYLSAQIEAGAEVIQIFESHAGLLAGDQFQRFIIKPTQELIRRVKKKYPQIPFIGFPRGAGENYISYFKKTGIDALGVDQNIPLDFIKENLRPRVPLQGNLDPELLLRGGEEMLQSVEKIREAFGPLHILNLGHGVLPQTPVEHVDKLVHFVRR